MIANSLRLVDDEVEAVREPQVFVRPFFAPAGMPWDQARMADLDARLGAPLPLTELTYRVRRLEPWRPARPCRYAAFYVRAADVGQGFVAEPEVDGAPVKVAFLSRAETRRRVRRVTAILGAAALSAVSCIAAGLAVVSARGSTADRLDAVEERAAVQLRRAEALEAAKRQARVLDAVHIDGRRVRDALNDIAWASAGKSATARVEGLHWDRGYMALEVRGDAPPFERPDRLVQRAPKPMRPGVWLWGVSPAGSTPSPQPAPKGSVGP